MRPLAAIAATTIAAAVSALTGCGGESDKPSEPEAVEYTKPDPTSRAADLLEPARCPAGGGNCRSADGRIVLVERVDPDGDGDAHFVLISDESITAPGISVIDVRRDLRPQPLPGVGDLISAAGPVFRGSLGQRQIQADVVHVAPG